MGLSFLTWMATSTERSSALGRDGGHGVIGALKFNREKVYLREANPSGPSNGE